MNSLEERVTTTVRAILHRAAFGTSPVIEAFADDPSHPSLVQVFARYREPHGAVFAIQAEAGVWLNADGPDLAERLLRTLRRINSNEVRTYRITNNQFNPWADMRDDPAWVTLVSPLPWNI